MSLTGLLEELQDLGIRVSVDGNELRVSAPKGTLTAELREQLVTNKAKLLTLLRGAKPAASVPRARIERVERHGPLPLSFAQERLWFIEQLIPGNVGYNIPMALRLKGALDGSVLESSLNAMVARHEALRTTFPNVDGEAPRQVIAEKLSLTVPVIDLREVGRPVRQEELRRRVQEEALRPFDLVNGPLLRATLLWVDQDEHVLLLVMHHIVSDGWSLGVLLSELGKLYDAFSAGEESPLEELPIQYGDFAVWQREWLQGETLESQLNYWKHRLTGAATLQLPTDRTRPTVQTFCGADESMILPEALAEKLESLSQREGATLFMTLLAAFTALLHRYTGQEDIVVGSPIANRTRAEIEGLIGFFINSLVMRTDVSGDPSFRELLSRVREVALGAYEHQDLPFEGLVQELQVERDLSRNPLFQVMFAVQNAPRPSWELSGLSVSPFRADYEVTRFDLEAHVWEVPEGLELMFVYSTDLFEASTICRMLDHYQLLLEAVVANPERAVSRLPLLSKAEEHRLLVEWNQTARDYPREATVHQLFEAQVERSPEAVAVEFDQQQWTYRELNARANQLAHYLKRHGVGPDVLVGVFMERSADMIVALLGILKAGGAYVPLDPEYPPARLAYMLQDTQAPVLLTQASLKEQLPAYPGRVVCLDVGWAEMTPENAANPGVEVTARNLAYVIYTSGSTGQPKGTCIEHRSVVRLVKNTNYVELGPDEVFLQFAPISFDASTLELWGALLNGAKLVVFPPGLPSLEELGEALSRYGVTVLWLTGGLFHRMVDEQFESLRGVRQLLAGGEALSVPHVQRMLAALGAGCRLINGYGPTENTTFSCCHVMTSESVIEHTVPIGRPISNTTVYILDDRGEPVSVGVWGELYIGGDGLARGYWNRPELTAEKFLADPFSDDPEARLYRTGDIVRYREDGNIEFIGRRDGQVKLRGFRIELGEIEAALLQHRSVREAVTVLREDTPGDKRLVAYVVADPAHDGDLSWEPLRTYLRERLPAYMIPAAFVMMEALPLTANGKLDRRALPVPEGERQVEQAYVAPRSELEAKIAQIWREALGLEQVGIDDNFFDLGGNSLLLLGVHAKLHQLLGRELPITELFRFPTIRALVRHCGATSAEGIPYPKVHERARRQRNAMSRQKQVKKRSTTGQ